MAQGDDVYSTVLGPVAQGICVYSPVLMPVTRGCGVCSPVLVSSVQAVDRQAAFSLSP